MLSKDETYLVLWLYSGQSEVGYELFTYRPTLKHIASFPYVYGKGFGPAFSADGRCLAMVTTTNSGLRIEVDEAFEGDVTTEQQTLAWAEVHVRALPEGATQQARIDVQLPAGTPLERDDSFYPTHLVATATEVTFRADWGVQVRIPLPLPDVVVIEGPTER